MFRLLVIAAGSILCVLVVGATEITGMHTPLRLLERGDAADGHDNLNAD